MPRIRGKFAPLFDELGNDERWLVECNDFEKFMFMLVLYTVYMNNGVAPLDPLYYQRRYGLRTRRVRLANTLGTLAERFPKLICKDKKLSLLNYVGYESGVVPNVPENKNKNKNKKEKENVLEAPGIAAPVPPDTTTGDIANAIMEHWNRHIELPRVLSMGGNRRDKLKVRLKNPVFATRWEEAVNRLARSSFATGKVQKPDGSSWKAGIDWFIDNDTNILKILEGKYDDHKGQDEVDKFVAGLSRRGV